MAEGKNGEEQDYVYLTGSSAGKATAKGKLTVVKAAQAVASTVTHVLNVYGDVLVADQVNMLKHIGDEVQVIIQASEQDPSLRSVLPLVDEQRETNSILRGILHEREQEPKRFWLSLAVSIAITVVSLVIAVIGWVIAVIGLLRGG